MANSDVRMKGFAQRATVRAALDWIDDQAKVLAAEQVELIGAVGRVLAKNIVSNYNVPSFRRAMMDGFAVYAADVMGATGYNRLPLDVVGQILPGQKPTRKISRGQAVSIMTGAAMPTGPDAVLPFELTEPDRGKIFAIDQVSPEKNVGAIGEDIQQGQEVLKSGRRLRPQDVGVLSSIGIAQVSVVRRPVVQIVITGNELLPPGSAPLENKIVDANSPMLRGLIERDGGEIRYPGIIPDEPAAIRAAMLVDCDIVLVSGGSSVGREDHAPVILSQSGELAIHGIAMRPSSPAGLGRFENRLVFLLPGNPVSCLCAYDFFAGRAIRLLGGRKPGWPYRNVRLPLARKLVSTIGRLDYARICIVDQQVEPLAISGASMLSSTTIADGFVIVSEDTEGFPAGAEVDVFLYD